MKPMRILSGILASVIATGCLLYSAPPKMMPDSVLNAYAATQDCLTFKVENGTATVTGCTSDAAGELVIPAVYEGVPVTAIGDRVFVNHNGLTKITLPDSIQALGSSTFLGAEMLKSVNIPGSIQTIPSECFYGCSSLTDVTISDGVIRIYYGAFTGCTALKEISFPESVTQIFSSAFDRCLFDRITVLNKNADVNGLGRVKQLCSYSGSTTEVYAKKNGIEFLDIETGNIVPGTTATAPASTTTWATTITRAITTTRATTQKASISTKSSIVLQDGLKKFDINKDNRVTIADAVLLTRFVSEDEAAVLPRNSEPDVDADGLVTIEDVMSVLHALQPFSIQIGKATAKPGEKVTVPIKIYADKGTAAGQIYVGCDSKLTPVSVKSSDAYTMNFYADCESYPITITWTAKGGKDQIAKNGSILAELEFEVDPNIKSPEYLEISIMNQAGSYTTSFSDSSGNTYTAGYRSGYITVIP